MGLDPSAAWTALPLHPLRLRDPSPTPAWAAPSQSIAKRARGVGGKREGEGGEGRAVVREGSSSCNGGDGGGPSKRQLGPESLSAPRHRNRNR